ncbi:MAG: hypothetical protein ACOCWQ_03660 [Nanoarchaeota archaeon]
MCTEPHRGRIDDRRENSYTSCFLHHTSWPRQILPVELAYCLPCPTETRPHPALTSHYHWARMSY